MTIATKLAGVALIVGVINILLSFLGILLGGGGEFVLYILVCSIVVTVEAAYLDQRRLGYLPHLF